MSNKTPLKLYKIDKRHFPEKNNREIISSIISIANAGMRGSKKFIEQDIKDDFIIPEGNTFVVYHALKEGLPGWIEAWRSVVAETSNMLRQKNSMSSYVAFISRGGDVYALTGGQGNSIIERFTESFFGLDIIDRLLESTQDRGIVEATKGGMTGILKTEMRTFFDLTDGSSQDSYETFFKNLKSKISPLIVGEYFGALYPNHDFKSFFQGGDYFLIKKSLKVEKIFDLIAAIERVFNERESSGHNKLIPIGAVKSEKIDFVKGLNEKLFADLFANQENPEALDNFYFAPKSIPEHTIDGSIFTFAEYAKNIVEEDIIYELPKVSEYVDFLLNIGRSRRVFARLRDFKDAFNTYKIYWKHTEEDRYKFFDVFDSVNGILEFNNRNYLRFEGHWYEMRQNFTEIIDSEFTKLINNPQRYQERPAYLSIWAEDQDEDTYNHSYLDNEEVLVAHKAIKKNSAESSLDRDVEYGDLLYLNPEEKTFVHVKKKCNGEMRVASAQVLMCIQKIKALGVEQEWRTFLGEYYDLIMMRENTRIQTNKITRNQFINIFAQRENLRVSLAISDSRIEQNSDRLSICGKFFFIKMFKDVESVGWGERFRVVNVCQ